MTYKFNATDRVTNDATNPFKIENVFLLLSAVVLISGAISILLDARSYFHDHEDKMAWITVALTITLFGTAVKFLITALSQVRFFLGRNYPVGLADEVPAGSFGMANGGMSLVQTLRQSALEFPEPQGPLNGVLYAIFKPLATCAPPIQAAAVQHFHAVVTMTGILLSMAASYFFSVGKEHEGMVSWIYLPLTGLSLLGSFKNWQTDDWDEDNVGNANWMQWKLIGLTIFTILAPVLIPRYMPALHLPGLWVPSFLLLTTAIVTSVIFLLSLMSQMDSVQQTSVSYEQTTTSMNCHPAQLWIKLNRELQDNWVRGVPNRVYANVVPGMTNSERDTFQGYLLEETQPTAFSRVAGEHMQSPHASRSYLIALNFWGLMLTTIAVAVGSYYASHFVDMPSIETSRVILIIIALVNTSVLAFRIAHLLWSRMYFKSRLLLIGVEGTFQTGEMRIGNQFSGQVQSRATVTRVQDATLRIWASDIVTISFGKAGKRFIMGLTPADGFAKATVSGLKEFATAQSSITAPTSPTDIELAKSIGRINEALASSFSNASVACKRGSL